MFTEKDLEQFKNKGTDLDAVHRQIENFKRGFLPIRLHAPAVPGKGILRYPAEEVKAL